MAVESYRESDHSVEIVIATDGAVAEQIDPETGDRFEEVLDFRALNTERLRSGAAGAFVDHSSGSVRAQIGSILPDTVHVQGGELRARIALSRDPENAGIVNDVVAGIRRAWSPGYRVSSFEPAGGMRRRAAEWLPFEVSLVGVNADFRAQTRSYTMHHQNSPATPAAGATAVDPNAPPAAAAPAAVPPAATMTRDMQILDVCSRAGLSAKRTKQYVDGELSAADVFERVLNQRVTRQSREPSIDPPEVRFGEDQRDVFTRAATHSVCERMGMPAPKSLPKGWDAGAYRGMALPDVARKCLELAGLPTFGGDGVVMQRALLMARSGITQTTSDFGAILTDSVNATLQARYREAPTTWRRWCGMREVADFRQTPIIRAAVLPGPPRLGEGGEIEHLDVPDGERVNLQAQTRAAIYGVSRQTLVNDRLGVFQTFSTDVAMGTARAVEIDAFAALQENAGAGPSVELPVGTTEATLFHADRNNIADPASPLTSNALNVDAAGLAAQTGVNGELLDLMPQVLLVSIANAGKARAIVASEYVQGTGTLMENPARGVLPMDGVIGTARITSSTARYLFADPTTAPTITVVYIPPGNAGMTPGAMTLAAGGSGPQPVLELLPPGDQDGIRWRLLFDVAIGVSDFRGAYYNAGA